MNINILSKFENKVHVQVGNKNFYTIDFSSLPFIAGFFLLDRFGLDIDPLIILQRLFHCLSNTMRPWVNIKFVTNQNLDNLTS